MSEIKQISDESFQVDVLRASLPVLVDYWAEWCGPCKIMEPILGEVASEYAGRLRVVKINISNNPYTPTQYAVPSIPALLLFRDGQLRASKTGALSKDQIKAFLDSTL